eukprot:5775048-Pyramimonas_sp.AAC.1
MHARRPIEHQTSAGPSKAGGWLIPLECTSPQASRAGADAMTAEKEHACHVVEGGVPRVAGGVQKRV